MSEDGGALVAHSKRKAAEAGLGETNLGPRTSGVAPQPPAQESFLAALMGGVDGSGSLFGEPAEVEAAAAVAAASTAPEAAVAAADSEAVAGIDDAAAAAGKTSGEGREDLSTAVTGVAAATSGIAGVPGIATLPMSADMLRLPQPEGFHGLEPQQMSLAGLLGHHFGGGPGGVEFATPQADGGAYMTLGPAPRGDPVAGGGAGAELPHGTAVAGVGGRPSPDAASRGPLGNGVGASPAGVLGPGIGAPAPAGGGDGGTATQPVPGGPQGSSAAMRKARLLWTQELHNRFVNALSHIGLKQAVPKSILTYMNVEGMTRENVASHLQKYRLQLRKQGGLGDRDRVSADTLQRLHEDHVRNLVVQQAMAQHIHAAPPVPPGGAAVAAAAAAAAAAVAAAPDPHTHAATPSAGISGPGRVVAQPGAEQPSAGAPVPPARGEGGVAPGDGPGPSDTAAGPHSHPPQQAGVLFNPAEMSLLNSLGAFPPHLLSLQVGQFATHPALGGAGGAVTSNGGGGGPSAGGGGRGIDTGGDGGGGGGDGAGDDTDGGGESARGQGEDVNAAGGGERGRLGNETGDGEAPDRAGATGVAGQAADGSGAAHLPLLFPGTGVNPAFWGAFGVLPPGFGVHPMVAGRGGEGGGESGEAQTGDVRGLPAPAASGSPASAASQPQQPQNGAPSFVPNPATFQPLALQQLLVAQGAATMGEQGHHAFGHLNFPWWAALPPAGVDSGAKGGLSSGDGGGQAGAEGPKGADEGPAPPVEDRVEV